MIGKSISHCRVTEKLGAGGMEEVVYRYDRYARSLRQLVNSLEDFRALGIDFISLHEGVDTSTPNGRLVFGIFASLAEFERELIRERVRSGLAAAKAKSGGSRRLLRRVATPSFSWKLFPNASESCKGSQNGCFRPGQAL